MSTMKPRSRKKDAGTDLAAEAMREAIDAAGLVLDAMVRYEPVEGGSRSWRSLTLPPSHVSGRGRGKWRGVAGGTGVRGEATGEEGD